MEEYINQLRMTAMAEIPFFTLMGTLVLIDACAALASENAETSRTKFKNWFNQFLPEYSIGNDHPCDFDSNVVIS